MLANFQGLVSYFGSRNLSRTLGGLLSCLGTDLVLFLNFFVLGSKGWHLQGQSSSLSVLYLLKQLLYSTLPLLVARCVCLAVAVKTRLRIRRGAAVPRCCSGWLRDAAAEAVEGPRGDDAGLGVVATAHAWLGSSWRLAGTRAGWERRTWWRWHGMARGHGGERRRRGVLVSGR